LVLIHLITFFFVLGPFVKLIFFLFYPSTWGWLRIGFHFVSRLGDSQFYDPNRGFKNLTWVNIIFFLLGFIFLYWFSISFSSFLVFFNKKTRLHDFLSSVSIFIQLPWSHHQDHKFDGLNKVDFGLFFCCFFLIFIF
jgi:hypothetical protein